VLSVEMEKREKMVKRKAEETIYTHQVGEK
jgi:hypothetical protein